MALLRGKVGWIFNPMMPSCKVHVFEIKIISTFKASLIQNVLKRSFRKKEC